MVSYEHFLHKAIIRFDFSGVENSDWAAVDSSRRSKWICEIADSNNNLYKCQLHLLSRAQCFYLAYVWMGFSNGTAASFLHQSIRDVLERCSWSKIWMKKLYGFWKCIKMQTNLVDAIFSIRFGRPPNSQDRIIGWWYETLPSEHFQSFWNFVLLKIHN